MRSLLIAACLSLLPLSSADAFGTCRKCVVVPQVKVVPLEVRPAIEYSTRWRPILGGWVTRGRTIWIPAEQPAPQQ